MIQSIPGEHYQLPPTDFFLTLNADLLPRVKGKSWPDICILFPWFSLLLPQHQGNFPFKLKKDLMFISIAAPPALRM